FGIPAEFVEESPFALIGSVDSVTETILAARERWGFSYFIVGGENIEEIAPVVAALKGK
ncbi:MAG: LLM class F420-dependent oxidoreductase, partial [Actinobacteria bacterium]|nr:LLM class F420-dependent oxidoreductase [Actinomycetota bacterium]